MNTAPDKPALERILDILGSYGCLEWAEGAEREQMAPYFEKMKTEIEGVLNAVTVAARHHAAAAFYGTKVATQESSFSPTVGIFQQSQGSFELARERRKRESGGYTR